ncbi:MAG: ParB/RepB/Spo0J family partition protein, partial [Burkholderiaceae bacterium]|nr:ParB/RepB/Spo0J family partition protein [Burkholderiaceae bacterium]
MNATVESNFAKPHFGDIPLQSVIPSKTNPRKSFNQAALEELAASIKSMGVAQPILVRPLPTTAEHIDCVEIVAGERRYRASKIAGMLTIPAVCREMTDAEAMQIQIIENLQREDVHEIEEAEGFQRLMKEHGHTAVEIAKAVSKSKEYIYGRLKLCALEIEVRQAFYDGKLNASTALLVARIPVARLQLEAAKKITEGEYNDGPMSYRKAVDFIQRKYMLALSSAIFSIKDAKLTKGVGACTACPKRTGAQPEIYPDVAEDTCTDPGCFEVKRTAHNDKAIAVATKKGLRIFNNPHDNDAVHLCWHPRLTDFERVAPEYNAKQYDPINKVLDADKAPVVAAYFKTSRGELVPMYEHTAMQDALEKAGLCETLAQHTARMNEKIGEGEEQSSTHEAQMAKKRETVDRENTLRLALYCEIRARTDLRITLLRTIAKAMLFNHVLPKDEIEYDFDASSDAKISEHMDQLNDEQELLNLMLDMSMSHTLKIMPHNLNTDGSVDFEEEDYLDLVTTATAFGVDVDLFRKKLAPAQVEKTATPAVKKDIKAIKAVVAKKTKEAKTPEAEPEYPADTPADNAKNGFSV